MKPMTLERTWILAALSLVSLLAGCGGGSRTTAPAPPASGTVAVSVNPSSTFVDQGATQQFAATVTGSTNTAVTWSVQESSGGSISISGLYAAPTAAGTFHVVATSQADPSKSAIATVNVPTVSVSITPSLIGVLPNQQRQFSAAVAGTVNQGVQWSVDEAVGGFINDQGLYTAPGTLGTFHITATSVSDSAQSAKATVVVTDKGFLPTGSMRDERLRHAATLLSDGRVLITGGVTSDGSELDTAEIYDPATGTFRFTSGRMEVPRAGHTATPLKDGRVLIAGGRSCVQGCLESAELYDPATEIFSSVGDMTVGRTDHTATLLADGRVLIVGGTGSNEATGSAELYDPSTGVFARTGALWDVDHAFGHTATLLSNDKVLIAGGVTSSDFVLGNAELYDPASGTFKATAPLARYYHTATLLNDGRVLVVGGSGGNFLLASAEVYDPASGSFTSTGSMAQKRWLSTANLLGSGRVLVAGGKLPGPCGASDECGLPTNIAELYDPVAGTFSPAASMNTSRVGHTATSLLDGRVLVTGGWNNDSLVVATAELYTP